MSQISRLCDCIHELLNVFEDSAQHEHTIYFLAVHLPGKENTLADALSRNNLSLLYSLFPQVNYHQTDVPAALIELLVGLRPDWTSNQWTNLWNAIFPWD